LFGQIFRAERGDGFGGGADEGDLGAHFLEKGFEEFRDAEGHVSFGDRFIVADLEPALFGFRPFAADVAGIDGDVEAGQWFFWWWDG